MGVARRMYGRRERHKRLWWGNLKEIYHLEHIGIVGRILLKQILNGTRSRELELIWYRIRRRGCCECGNETSDYRKFGGMSWLALHLAASQERIRTMQLNISNDTHVICSWCSFTKIKKFSNRNQNTFVNMFNKRWPVSALILGQYESIIMQVSEYIYKLQISKQQTCILMWNGRKWQSFTSYIQFLALLSSDVGPRLGPKPVTS